MPEVPPCPSAGEILALKRRMRLIMAAKSTLISLAPPPGKTTPNSAERLTSRMARAARIKPGQQRIRARAKIDLKWVPKKTNYKKNPSANSGHFYSGIDIPLLRSYFVVCECCLLASYHGVCQRNLWCEVRSYPFIHK